MIAFEKDKDIPLSKIRGLIMRRIYPSFIHLSTKIIRSSESKKSKEEFSCGRGVDDEIFPSIVSSNLQQYLQYQQYFSPINQWFYICIYIYIYTSAIFEEARTSGRYDTSRGGCNARRGGGWRLLDLSHADKNCITGS